MRSAEFTETINPKVFARGFESTKSIVGKRNGVTYLLKATNGPLPYIPGKKAKVSDQFRIEAYDRNVLVGWVNFKVNDIGFGESNLKLENLKLEAIDVKVDDDHTRQGVASAMYKFAEELGNDITPSAMQTGDGRAFWAGKE